mgnify:CR=1 FL=1
MLKSLWNGVNGVKTQNLGVDITANNISNVNTIGFKRTSSEFADIFYQRVVSRSANPAEIGSGSLLSASKVVYEQGSFTDGEGEFDVALMGKGFFGVRGFSQTYYTRNGEFTRDGNNYLVDASGNFVLGTVNPNLVPTQFSDRVAQAMGRLNGTNDLVTSGFTVNNPNQDFTIAPSTMQTKLFVPSKNMYYFPEVTTQATFKGTISAVLNTATQRIGLNTEKTDKTSVATFKPTGVKVSFGGSVQANQGAAENDEVEITLTDGNTPENTKIYKTKLDANLNFTSEVTIPDDFDSTNVKVKSAKVKKGQGQADIEIKNDEFPTLTKTATTGTLNGNLAGATQTGTKGDDGKPLAAQIQNGDKVVITLKDKNNKTLTTNELTIDNDKKFSLTNLNATDGFDMASASIANITQVGERSTYEDKAFGVRVYNLDGSVSSLKYNLHLTNTNRTSADDFIYEVVAGVYDDDGALIGSESRGQITFNQHGALISNTLTSVPNPQGGTININFGTPTNSPSTDRTGAGWDGVYILPESKSDAITSSGNGVAEGFFNRYQIEQDGSIIVQFTNGKTVTVGKLALYTFINEQGLAVVGGNNFMATSNSGAASFLYDNEGKLVRPALFVGQKLEMSNTDLSTELTNLIVMQRGFEASSKSITTSDSMLQTAIGLKK